MINVDTLIENRAPQIAKKPWLSKPITLLLRYLTHEKAFLEFEHDYPHLDGLDFIDQVLEYFDFDYQISDRHLERIPTQGKVVIVANHPLGSLDGLALVKLVKQLRPDVKIVANEMLMAIKPLHSLLLPVNNMGGRTARQSLQRIHQHIENQGALIIFPAGEVSRLSPAGVKDGKWNSGFLRIAKKGNAPILPIFVDGRNSLAFYLASAMFKPLSTLLLIKEMFKQTRRNLTIKVGHQIAFDDLPRKNLDKTASLVRQHLYRIAKGKSGLFSTQQSIAHPEDRQTLKSALETHEVLGHTTDGQKIFLCKDIQGSPILREISRLREISFRAVGEGTGNKRDMDRFDSHYHHIVLWDPNELELVGAYRLADSSATIAQQGKSGLYTASLFEFGDEFKPFLDQGLELGRSFVQPKYWGKRSLDYLWQGIGAYLKAYPGPRYLFGPASIPNQIPPAGRELMVYFYQLYFPAPDNLVQHRHPYYLSEHELLGLFDKFSGEDYEKDFKKLKSLLASMGASVPTLYKQYSELVLTGGVWFTEFGTDPNFADCVDGMVVLDLEQLKPKKKSRYLS